MMKFKKFLCCLIISLTALNAFSISSSFAAPKTQLFKPSKAGRISTVVANTILNGVTPPKNSEGIDGDFYIDTKALLFYGPKSKSHWPTPRSIRGPQGQTGPSGLNGTDAKPSANVISVGAQGLTGAIGPKGEQGPQGIPGVAGAVGLKGEAGETGPPGASGASGSNGAQGVSGPQGVQGANGAVGPVGPSGSVGATGPAGAIGATGPTGPTGATGPSHAWYGLVNFTSPIQGVIGSAQTSSNFGAFEAGKSYVVRIRIQTFNIDRLILSYPLSLDITTQGATPSLSVAFAVSNGSSFTLSVRRDEVTINAEVILDGSQVVNPYSLSATITCGSNTGSFPITLIGNYHAILVGQVTQTS